MTNRLRAEIEEEEAELEAVAAEKTRAEEKRADDSPENFLVQFFAKNQLTTQTVTKALPFIFYLVFLGMVYIANRHRAENNLRDIEAIHKQVKELSWGYKMAKADLAYKSTLSEVEKKAVADSLEIKPTLDPPQKLVVKEDENGN